MYRLFLDLPLFLDPQKSIDVSKKVLDFLSTMEIEEVNNIQYRLGNDTDRGNKNYLDVNENGHASNKKGKIVFQNENKTN